MNEVTAEHNREMLFKANEDFIVIVQSHMRGYLVRKAYQDRLQYLHNQLPAIKTIQVTLYNIIQCNRTQYNTISFMFL